MCSWCLYTNNSVALSLKHSDPNLLLACFVMYIFRDNVRPDRYLTSVTKPHYQIWTSACMQHALSNLDISICNWLWTSIVNPGFGKFKCLKLQFSACTNFPNSGANKAGDLDFQTRGCKFTALSASASCRLKVQEVQTKKQIPNLSWTAHCSASKCCAVLC